MPTGAAFDGAARWRDRTMRTDPRRVVCVGNNCLVTTKPGKYFLIMRSAQSAGPDAAVGKDGDRAV
jgi:hypothetical protein